MSLTNTSTNTKKCIVDHHPEVSEMKVNILKKDNSVELSWWRSSL